MSFQVHLARVVDGAEGSLSCLLMGQDGIPVDSFDNPAPPFAFDSTTLGIEYTAIFLQLNQIHENTETGTVHELMVNSDQVVALFHFLSPEYFLLLTLAPEGNVGKGRYLLRVAASALQQELL